MMKAIVVGFGLWKQ